MDLRETELEDVDWINVSQDRDWRRDLLNTLMNIQVPYKAVGFLRTLLNVVHSW
jgi:hypothetical protein